MKSTLFHIFRLYLRLCSPLRRVLFVILSLAKLILFLDLSICNVNDSSMRLERAVTSLLSPILLKADAKLLKQQVLDESRWYSITEAAGWNTIFSVIFSLPIGTKNNWCVFVSWPLILFFDKVIYRHTGHVSWNFLLITHDKDQTRVLIFRVSLGSYILLSFPFHFKIRIFITDHDHRWEFMGHHRDFFGVMAFYLFWCRTKRILFTAVIF